MAKSADGNAASAPNYFQIRKKSLKHACRTAVNTQQPVVPRHRWAVWATALRRPRACKPATFRGLEQVVPDARFEFSPGTQGTSANSSGQKSSIGSGLKPRMPQTCDVLVLQETHWKETAEFTSAGWYCVSSAAPVIEAPAEAVTRSTGRGGSAQRKTRTKGARFRKTMKD